MSTETEDIETLFKVMILKEGEYHNWREWFLSYARLKNCRDILTGKTKAPPDSEKITTYIAANKKKLKARTANDVAYNMLLTATRNAIDRGAVTSAKTTALPDGDTAQAWTYLEQIHKSITNGKREKLKKKFEQSELKDKTTRPDE